MSLNPSAVAVWAFCASVGYLVGSDLRSAVIGLTVGLGLSLVSEVFG